MVNDLEIKVGLESFYRINAQTISSAINRSITSDIR